MIKLTIQHFEAEKSEPKMIEIITQCENNTKQNKHTS